MFVFLSREGEHRPAEEESGKIRDERVIGVTEGE